MKLPKGTLTGSMKILAPLLIWMSAGWFSYPYLIGYIYDAVGESIDIEELRTFSLIMTVVCLGLGILFLILGVKGPKLDEDDFKRMTGQLVMCEHCRLEMKKEVSTITCEHCGKFI